MCAKHSLRILHPDFARVIFTLAMKSREKDREMELLKSHSRRWKMKRRITETGSADTRDICADSYICRKNIFQRISTRGGPMSLRQQLRSHFNRTRIEFALRKHKSLSKDRCVQYVIFTRYYARVVCPSLTPRRRPVINTANFFFFFAQHYAEMCVEWKYLSQPCRQ